MASENILKLTGVSGKKSRTNAAVSTAMNGLTYQSFSTYMDAAVDKIVKSVVSVSNTIATKIKPDSTKSNDSALFQSMADSLEKISNLIDPQNSSVQFADSVSKVITPEFASALLGMKSFMNQRTVKTFNSNFLEFTKGLSVGLNLLNKDFSQAIDVLNGFATLKDTFSLLLGSTETRTINIFGKTYTFTKQKKLFDEPLIKDFEQGFVNVAMAISNGMSSIGASLNGSKDTIESLSGFLQIIATVLGSRYESPLFFSLFGIDIANFSRNISIFSRGNIKKFNNAIMAIGDSMLLFASKLKKIEFEKETIDSISSITEVLNKFASDEWKSIGQNLRSISVGLTTLSVSALLFSSLSGVVTKAATGLDKFVNILSESALKLGSSEFGNAAQNLKMLSSGLATIGLASVAFVALSPITIAAMGILRLMSGTLNLLGSKELAGSLAKFTLGIAGLGLAIWGFSEIVSIEGMMKTAGALALLAGAIYLFDGVGNGKMFGGIKTSNKSPIKTMLAISGGIALMALSIWAWDGLVNDVGGGTYVSVVAALAGIAGVMWVYDKVSGKSTKNILFVAAGVTALGLAIKVWDWLGPNPTTALIAIGSVAALGGAMLLWKTVPVTAALSMLGAAAGTAAIGLSLQLFKSIPIETMMAAGATTLALAGIAAIYSNPLTMAGSVSMLAVGAGILALSGGLTLLSKLPDMTQSIDSFMYAAKELCLGFAMLSLPAVAAAIGATAMIPVAASTVIVAGSIALIQMMSYDPEKIDKFGAAMLSLSNAWEDLSIVSLGKSVLKAAEMVIVAGATLPVAGLIWLINKIPMNPDKIKNGLEPSLVALQDAWEELSLLSMTKGAVKAGEMLVLAAGTMSAIRAIRAIQQLSIDKPLLDSNLLTMSSFIDSSVELFESVADKAERVKESVGGVKSIGDACYSLARAIQSISKLEITEFEVQNGKVVPVRVRKLTDKDFENVGLGVAKMLSSLTNPLLTIAEAGKNDYSIMGIKIAGQNKIQTAINSVSGIGSVFTPIAELINAIGSTDLLKSKDTRGIDNLKLTLSTITDALHSFIGKIVTLNIGNQSVDLSGATDGIAKLFNVINKIDPTGIQTVRSEIDAIFEKVSNDKPWAALAQNMIKYAGAVLSIKNSINGIELEKMVSLERFAEHVKDANMNGNIEKLIHELKELVNVTSQQTDAITSGFGAMSDGLGEVNSNLQPEVSGNTSGFDVPAGDYDSNSNESNQKLYDSGNNSAAEKIAQSIQSLTQAIKSRKRI